MIDTQVITLITDIQLNDFSPMDKYFQTVCIPNCAMTQWQRMIRKREFQIKCELVWIMVGNSELPFPCDLSAINQMRKLIMCIIGKSSRKFAKIVVGSVLPRLDKEVQLEQQVMDMNLGFSAAVKDLRRNQPLAKNVEWLPVHKLFLERYEFVDFGSGLITHQIRIRKPIDRYFVPGMAKLNPVGLAHLCSYVLQTLGILTGVNTWSGIPVRMEPREIQEEKCRAWLKAQGISTAQDVVGVDHGDSDTDVEDEGTVPRVWHRNSEGKFVPDSREAGRKMMEVYPGEPTCVLETSEGLASSSSEGELVQYFDEDGDDTRLEVAS